MEKEEMIKYVIEVLQRGGFTVGVPVVRSMVFDVIARRDNEIYIIKVLVNADALRLEMARELKILSKEFEAIPILIGLRSGAGKILDGVVYSRHGIPVISVQTFKEFILEDEQPMVYVAPGGFYVNIDGDKLKKVRQERGISLGELGRIAGVSRKTIQLYEEGMSSTVDIALRLEEFLGEELIEPVDLKNFAKLTEERYTLKNVVFEDIYRRLMDMGYDVFLTLKCPFEALSKDESDVMLTGFENNEKKLKYKSRNIRIFSEILDKRGFIITSETRYDEYNGVALIRKTEVMHYTKDELKKVVEERSSI